MIGEQENVLIKWADPVRTFDLEGVRLFSIYKHPESVYDALRKISVAGKPELYYDVSLLNWTIGSLSSAIRNMQEYLILYPNDQKAVRFLLTMLIDNDQPLQALQVIEKYESQAGDKSGFDLLQAEACTRAGRDDEAIGLLNKVLAENRFETNALRMLGMIYYKKNIPDQAKKYFLRLLEINPNQKAGLQMLAWIHQKEGDIAAARRYYYGWLEMNPADVPILINTGGLELQSGRTAAADSLFRRVLKLDVGNLNACLNLANLFAGAGETDSAIVYLRLAATAHPEQQEKIEKEYLPALLGKPVIPATGAANPAPAKP